MLMLCQVNFDGETESGSLIEALSLWSPKEGDPRFSFSDEV